MPPILTKQTGSSASRRVPGKRRMVGRHERRTLPAMHHVVRPHVVNDRDAGLARKQPPVAKLDGQRLVGPVQHGLAVESDDIDRALDPDRNDREIPLRQMHDAS